MKRIIACLLFLAMAVGSALAQQPEVSPNPAETMPGGMVQFSVPGQAQADVSWQVLPPSLGSIDEKGLFTAGSSSGQGIVRAIVQNGSSKSLGHALIKVTGGKIRGLAVKVNPSSSRMEPGGTGSFAAEAVYLNGDPALDASLSWQVVPAGLGTIDQYGNFTALNPGTGRIVALARSDKLKGMGQAKITVGPLKPQKLKVELTPPKANLKPGESAAFSALVKDRDGNPVAAAVEFRVDPAGLGSIDGEGNFTAGKNPGVGTVSATFKSTNGPLKAKSLVVVEETSQHYTVRIKPRQSALGPGQALEFTAEAFDNSGNQITPPYWVWKVIPEKLGEISPQGIFTAGQKPGQGKLVASLPIQFGLGQAAASIRIKPGQPLRVKIDPPSARLLIGQPQQFTAEVFTAQGQPVPNVKILWKVYPEGVGTINQNGFFRASDKPGLKGAVLAVVSPQQGGGQGAAPVSISANKVKISGPSEVLSGESCTFSATVTIGEDGYVPVTAYQLKWLTDPISQQFGTINQAGVFTAGHPAGQIDGWVIVRASINGLVITDKIAVRVKTTK